MSFKMPNANRQMHLGLFWLGTGNHSAGWRYDGAAASNCSWPVVLQGAQIAERGKFDLFFISDSVIMDPGDHPSFVSRFEPTTLIAALSAVTRHVGLGATASISFSEPYVVARTFATLHHISGGRAAWNIVTSTHNAAAFNFDRERLAEHDLRYEMANEFVDVVKGLWNTWDEARVVADRTTGVFLDKSKVRPLDHKGRFYSVKGPLNIERSPHGYPLIVQAGRLAARAGPVGADRRFRVLGRQWRQGIGQGRVRQSQAARRSSMAAHPTHVTGPARRHANHRRDRRGSQGSSSTRCRAGRHPTNALSAGVAAASATTSRATRWMVQCPSCRRPPYRGQAFSQRAARDGPTRDDDAARSLQHHGGGARPLGHLTGRRSGSPISWRSGSAAEWPTASTSCRPIFPAPSTTSSIWSCPSFNGGGLYRKDYSGPTLRAHLGLARRRVQLIDRLLAKLPAPPCRAPP